MLQADPNRARYPSLEGASVFITGGATGIGASLVRGFAGQGAKVAFIDIAEDAGAGLAEELNGGGGTVLFIPGDITDTAALRQAVRDAADAHGAAGVLVNNAANDDRHDWREVTPDYWDERAAINLKPMFFAIQAVAPAMIERGRGAIINFGSVSWMLKQGGMPGYTASKAAVHGLTRSFASDLGQHGIRVNTLVPGWVMTERQLQLWVDAEGERKMDEGLALKGRVQPDDIAAMALFLAADDSRMCSAQNFVVDAGWT